MAGSQRRTAVGLFGIWALLVALVGSVSWVAIASVGQGLGQSLPGNRSAVSAAGGSSAGVDSERATTPVPTPSSSSPPPQPSVTVTKTRPAGSQPTVTVTTRVTIAVSARTGTAERETFSLRGGAVTVRCESNQPVLVGTRPKSGWSLTWAKRSGQLVVRFTKEEESVEVALGCTNNRPVRVG